MARGSEGSDGGVLVLIIVVEMLLANRVEARGSSRRSADFQSAVSQTSGLRGDRKDLVPRARNLPADCKSAIQQIGNLRYAFGWSWP
jgi:hypothetical protein